MNGLTIEGVWSGQTFSCRKIKGTKTRQMDVAHFPTMSFTNKLEKQIKKKGDNKRIDIYIFMISKQL